VDDELVAGVDTAEETASVGVEAAEEPAPPGVDPAREPVSASGRSNVETLGWLVAVAVGIAMLIVGWRAYKRTAVTPPSGRLRDLFS
jgi:hypothetical protein